MSDFDQHQKLRYGDIIYIEFTNKSDKMRRVLYANGFNFISMSFIDSKPLISTEESLYLQDFENNLFMIFPKMKDEFLKNKSTLSDKIIKAKNDYIQSISSSLVDKEDFKNDVTSVISTFQETKQMVYSENERLHKEIGEPILYKDEFILIHFKSNCFVRRNEKERSKLTLTGNYTDLCEFFFSPWSSLDINAQNVYSNQNLYLCKKEKNAFGNNYFLSIEDEIKSDRSMSLDEGKDKNFDRASRIFFEENQDHAISFKIKIYSSFIDPSSGNLSFATPVWFVCQNINRNFSILAKDIPYEEENILDKNNNIYYDDEEKNKENSVDEDKKTTEPQPVISHTKYSLIQPNMISFNVFDRENSLNDIHGLFYVEQYDSLVNNINDSDSILNSKMKYKFNLSMSSSIEYHKIIRFRHVSTGKYLGFVEQEPSKNIKDVSGILYEKANGSIILADIPNENCNWMFMESYKILDKDKYLNTKSNGISFKKRNGRNNVSENNNDEKKNKKKDDENNNNNDNKNYSIKNNEILRILHVKSQKFLCFDDINNKVKRMSILDNENEKKNVEEKYNISLTKTPYDSDLIRLVPTTLEQTWEILLVLCFDKILTTQISKIKRTNFSKLLKIPAKRGSVLGSIIQDVQEDQKNSEVNALEKARSRSDSKKRKKTILYDTNDMIKEFQPLEKTTMILKATFINLTNFCLNLFSRKFDIGISPGMPMYYRQQFLFSQGFAAKTFEFLEATKTFAEFYSEYIKKSQKKLEIKFDKKAKNKYLVRLVLENLNETIKTSFLFISALCKKNQNNKKFAFQYKKIFLEYLLKYEEASDCFLDIIKDDENIMNLLSKEGNESEDETNDLGNNSQDNIILMVLNNLNMSETYEIKNLLTLSTFLKTGDSGITSNQEYIFDQIFVNGKDRFLVKIKPIYEDVQFLVVYKNENNQYIQKTLIEFCSSQLPYEQTVIKYLAKQLDLFADLCYGRNYVCIEKIKALFPLDHLIYHISKVELNQHILAGLINILNYVYIDIEPHTMTVYPSLIKVITPDYKIERVDKEKIKSYIPLDKLNLIICLSLFILNNIKYGKVYANIANLNLIFNIIKFRLYENVVYSPSNIKECINKSSIRKKQNLKDEVKNNVIRGEEILISKNQNKEKVGKKNEGEDDIVIDENQSAAEKKLTAELLNTFYYKFGYKYIEFNFEYPSGEEYLLFILDRINAFFLDTLIINGIDSNTENKNIISQNFKSPSNYDVLTSSNIYFLVDSLMEIKLILTNHNNNQSDFTAIITAVEDIIGYILNIKTEDMSIYLIENLLKANKEILENTKNEKLDSELTAKFYELKNLKEILLDDEYYYYQLFNHINCSYDIPKIFDNSPSNETNEYINICEEIKNEGKKSNHLIDTSKGSLSFDDTKSLISSSNNTSNKDEENSNENYQQYMNQFQEDDNYFYNQLNTKKGYINLDNFFMNAVIFKNILELIIRILEMNADDKMTSVLIRIFTRLISQRKELFNSIKNCLLLYKEKDIQKYYFCKKSIVDLGLLSEKTENWMTDEKVINTQFLKNPDGGRLKDEDMSQKEFFAVYYTIFNFTNMIVDKDTGVFFKKKEVKLMQTIFHSFQIENILSSLLREIIQAYPEIEDENEEMDDDGNKNNSSINSIDVNKKSEIDEKIVREKKLKFKKSLELLTKIIFKLFQALVHHTVPNPKIIEVIEFAREYKYFEGLGYVKFLTELSFDSNYAKTQTKFLLDFINKIGKQLEDSTLFKKIKRHYLCLDEEFKNLKQHNEYKRLLKKAVLALKLMKNLIKYITNEKFLDIILKKYEDILLKFTIFKGADASQRNSKIAKKITKRGSIAFNESKKSNLNTNVHLYTMQFDYYLLQIAYLLYKKHQRLKQYISKLFNIVVLRQYIFNIAYPFTIEQLRYIVKYQMYKKTKVLLKLKEYFRLKNIGVKLYYELGRNSFMHMKSMSFNPYLVLYKDLKYVKMIKETIEFDITQFNYKILGFSRCLDYYKKYMYGYFFVGLFQLIAHLKGFNLHKPTIHISTNGKEEVIKIENVENEWNILLKQLYSEKNDEVLKKLFLYLRIRAFEFKNFFKNAENLLKNENHKIVKSRTSVIDSMRRAMMKNQRNQKELERKKSLHNKDDNELDKIMNNKPNKDNENEKKNELTGFKQEKLEPKIFFEILIDLTNTLINEMGNNEKVLDSINKETKILANHLQSKINFHSIVKKTVDDIQANEELVESIQGQDRDIHLVNIFLKFIQENYSDGSYTNEIKRLIELMSNIIWVSPEILTSEKKIEEIEYDFFYKNKFAELQEMFVNHCQKFFLNNSSIEIFVKIACETNQNFYEYIFPFLIMFFNNILEGGNIQVQNKFTQLFQMLPNSDNFFCYIYQSFNKDLFSNLSNDPTVEDQKQDHKNLNEIKNLLKFLQLLAENHNNILQNYLREQTTNRLSYNFVNILVEYLSMLIGKLSNIHDNKPDLSRYYIILYFERLLSLFDTICEFLQGPCQKNQEFLISTKIIDIFGKILDEVILNPDNKIGFFIPDTETANVEVKNEEEESDLASSETPDYTSHFGEETIDGRRDLSVSITKSFTYYMKDNMRKPSKKKGDKKDKLSAFQNKLFYPLTKYEKSLLVFKISLVLLSIIEGRKTKDAVIKKVLRDFDFKLIFEKCNDIHFELEKDLSFFLYAEEDNEENDLSNKIVAEAGFNLFFFIQYLLSFENEETEFKKFASILMKNKNNLRKFEKEFLEEANVNYQIITETMQFYSQNSVSIEILKDDNVFRVYCPKLQFFRQFDDKMKKNFDEDANRTSIQTKLMSLMSEKDKLYHTLKQLYSLQEKFKGSRIFTMLLIYPDKIELIGLILIIIMNLLIFFGFKINDNDDEEQKIFNVEIFTLSLDSSKIVLKALGFVIAFFSLLIFFEFLTREAVIIFKRLYTKYLREIYESKINKMDDLEINRMIDYLNTSGLWNQFKKVSIYLWLLLDLQVLYAICYFVFAIVGIFVHNFFFAFHLIEFIKSQPILQYVFKAIYEPLTQILYTYLFFFILIYFYSLIIFYNFYDIMPKNSCESPAICMLAIYSNTFTSGGNLGNFIVDGGHANEDGNMVRYALDISYTIIMVWLVWQMVSGLIVDTFNSLRGEREEKEKDMVTICFICGLKREKIEKYYPGKEGFENHLSDHSVSNYLFYSFYLEDKDPSEYSGLESYVKEHIDKESILWFPIERALKIEEWEASHKTNNYED